MQAAKHRADMRPPHNAREVQRLLRPHPNAYCVVRQRFGVELHAIFRMPDDPRATTQDMWLAQKQHLIVVDWIRRGRQPSTTDIQQRYGISRQLMHLTATGQRWMGLEEACALEVVLPLRDRS